MTGSVPGPHEYPRVLLVNIQAFNLLSGPGITLTNLFRGWPSDRIAMIHSDAIPPTNNVCHNYYRLGRDETTLIRPLRALQRWRRARSTAGADPSRPVPRVSLRQRAIRRLAAPVVRRFYVGDIVTTFHISAALGRWVDAFQPDILYVQLASYGYMRLVDALMNRTRASLAIHFMDDWPMTLHNHFVVRSFMRSKTTALLDKLLSRATVRMGISPRMAHVYEQRYGYPFHSFHNPIDAADVPSARPGVGGGRPPFRLVFAGTLNLLTTLEAVRDVCDAVESLRRAGVDVEFHIYAQQAAHAAVLVRPGVIYAGYLADQREAALMHAQADVLILPLNFNPSVQQFISLSMPTKTTSYMASGTPILVYAPRATALVEYATEGQWAHVVAERDAKRLARAILQLCTDQDLRRRLSDTARTRVLACHTIETVTTAFHRALIDGARTRARLA